MVRAEGSLKSPWATTLAISTVLLVALAACGPANDAEALNVKAREALEQGRPHLAWLIASKAREPSVPLSLTEARAAMLDRNEGRAVVALEAAIDLGLRDAGVFLDDPLLAPLLTGPSLERARRVMQSADGGLPAGEGLVASTPEAEGIDPAGLSALLEAARKSSSAALVVLRHGRLVGHWTFDHQDRRVELMSATKSFVSLAVGLLIDDGRIPSLDAKVSTWFPEWAGTPKDAITVRMLLNHTSGLAVANTTYNIYSERSFVCQALDAPLASVPGTAVQYNNSATNLAAAVVARAAGEPIEALLSRRLFAPMGIVDFTWSRDAEGNRHGMSGLQLRALDAAKVGQLLVQRGRWNGQQLLSERWIEQSTSEAAGLLWWLTREVQTLKGATLEAAARRTGKDSIVRKLQPLFSQATPIEQLPLKLSGRLRPWELHRLQKELHRRDEQALDRPVEISGPVESFHAAGYLGQYILVVPSEELVVVRLSWSEDLAPGVELDFQGLVPRSMALVRGVPDGGFDE